MRILELECIVERAIRNRIDDTTLPVLAREVREHLMRALLQEDWLARYVARNRIELPPLAPDVPAHVVAEIQKLEPVSLCLQRMMLFSDELLGFRF